MSSRGALFDSSGGQDGAADPTAGSPHESAHAEQASSHSRSLSQLNGQYLEHDVAGPSGTQPSDTRRNRRSVDKRSRQSTSQRRPTRTYSMDRRRSVPESFYNLDEVALPDPVENPDESRLYRHHSLEEQRSRGSHARPSASEDHPSQRGSIRRSSTDRRRSVPDNFYKLNEVALPDPIENPGEGRLYRHRSLEDRLSRESRAQREVSAEAPPPPEGKDAEKGAEAEWSNPQGIFRSRVITELCAISHLAFFSILGTLARLGLEALTSYPGAPVVFTTLWVNFGGSLFLGFLVESSEKLNGVSKKGQLLNQQDPSSSDGSRTVQGDEPRDEQRTEEQQDDSDDDTPPRQPSLLYIGLCTGFCGSFTTFSSFARDIFLALSNTMATPPPSRSIGHDVMAPLGVIIATLFLCLAAVRAGAHIAILVGKVNWVPPGSLHGLLNRAMLFVGFGTWAGAIIMTALPPDRPYGPSSHGSGGAETWRGLVLFASVFAPVGCILRFYMSIKLNSLQPGFPIGTFAANIIGTVILGLAYDLQHSAPGSARVSCQVLQGIMDGFCGCLTTVSTWVAELGSLRRKHAYVYGAATLGISLGLLVIIMGSQLWTAGWTAPTCAVVG